jgi:hypothetical protein
LYHRNEASNVLANDPSGLDFGNGTQHFREEVAVILRSLSSSCKGERLAWKAACEDIHTAPPFRKVCFSDVFISLTVGKPIMKYTVAEFVNLAMEKVRPAHPCCSKFGSSYAAE